MPPVNYEEIDLLMMTWKEEFGLDLVRNRLNKDSARIFVRLETRRIFALLPIILRKCERLGYDVGIFSAEYAYDFPIEGKDAFPLADPRFWQVLALGQMWYGPDPEEAL